MSLEKLSVGTRLVMAFGLMLLLIASIAGVGLFNASRLNDGMTEIVEAKVPKMVAAGDLNITLLRAAQDVRDIGDADDAGAVRQHLDLLAGHRAERQAIIDTLTRTLVKPKGIAALKVINIARAPFEAREAEFVKLASAGDKAGAKALVPAMRPLLEAYLDAVYKLVVINRDVIVHSMQEARGTYGVARNTALALLAASLAVGLTTALWMSRSLLRQLGGEPREAAKLAHAVSAGDLTTPVRLRAGDDHSLMAQLAGMQTRLSLVVQNVRSGADGVATASVQIASGNNDLSGRTEQQAGALEQTASSMEQFGSTVRENAENARQANHLAIDASDVALRGGTVVSQVVDTMRGINDSSRRIADIIGVIDGIAFQTNILALNAAVEAARAGEQGRGFAVVASEVRSLAQRSADAAREIKSLINASVERVERGTALVDTAGSTMTEVVNSITRLNAIVGQITTASAHQNTGVEQVGKAVRDMDRSTQQNAALVEQSAAAAESLKSQAAQLVQTVAVFKLAPGAA